MSHRSPLPCWGLEGGSHAQSKTQAPSDLLASLSGSQGRPDLQPCCCKSPWGYQVSWHCVLSLCSCQSLQEAPDLPFSLSLPFPWGLAHVLSSTFLLSYPNSWNFSSIRNASCFMSKIHYMLSLLFSFTFLVKWKSSSSLKILCLRLGPRCGHLPCSSFPLSDYFHSVSKNTQLWISHYLPPTFSLIDNFNIGLIFTLS